MLIAITGGAGPFIPSGMNKSGSYALTTAYAPATGWTADTATYPGSSVSGTALVAQASGTTTLSASAIFTSPGGSITVTAQLTVNGTVVNTGTPVTGASGTALSSWTGSVTAGDLIRLEVKANTNFGGPSVTGGFVRAL